MTSPTPPAREKRELAALLLERLRSDGGRYLLSVAMTPQEIAAEEKPTFGNKGTRRWLTEFEHETLCDALRAARGDATTQNQSYEK